MKDLSGRKKGLPGIIVSSVLCILSVSMLVWPALMTLAGFNLALLLLGLSGIIQILQYVGEPEKQRSGWQLGCGILISVTAAILLLQPVYSKIAAFSFVFAFCAFMNGFHLFSSHAAGKRLKDTGSGWLIFGGSVSLLVGAFFCIYPLLSAEMAVSLYAIYAVAASVWMLCYSAGERRETCD